MQLIVGNVSTWSMRAWMCLTLAELDFDVKVVSLDAGGYKETLNSLSETGLVPVLNYEDISVHDSLAIAEFANELSAGAIYPNTQNERAIARSLCSELHSGFLKIRTHYPFSWSASPVQNVSNDIHDEVSRLTKIWAKAKGSFYFADPSVVDAFYAVLAFRLKSYGITLSGQAGQYQTSLLDWPIFTECLDAAKKWA